MDKKKSIINIQDLGLSAASQHSIGGQPKLQVILENFLFLERKFHIFVFLFLESFFLFLEFSGYRRAADTLNESRESFKKSINKRFVHN
jgi:hypothetical protein